MKRYPIALKYAVAVIGILFATRSSAQHSHTMSAEDVAKYKSHVVTVSGDVEHPYSFTRDTLMAWGLKHGESIKSGSSSTYDYVDLKEVLKKAVVKQKNGKDRAFYIVARGSDGYTVVYSWADVMGEISGENLMILVKENGAPIEDKGDMKITGSAGASSQHIYFLKSIEVHHVE